MTRQKQRRWTTEVVLELDPRKAEERKKAARYRLNAVQFPIMREIGFALLSLFVLVHNYYLYQSVTWDRFFHFILIAFSYSLISWCVLYRFYGKTGRFDLGVFFLTLDIVVFAVAVYLSGGQQSLLFFLFIVRVADQTNTSFKRVLWFAHVSPAIYVMLLLYLHFGEGEDIWRAREIPKIFGIYACNLYISLTAVASERLRDRTTAAMRLARRSILSLKAKSWDLEEARMRAEAANIAKSEFLANINHEIRTPLHGVIGMTDLVLDTPLNPQQREYMEHLKASAASLSTLLNGILDLTRAESAEAWNRQETFALRDVLTDLEESLAPQAAQKGLELTVTTEPDVPDNLIGDPERLKDILGIVAGNAIKFTDAGEVHIGVRLEAIEEGSASLEVVVADTGMGIPPAGRESIFHLFNQGDGSSTRRHGGVGVGLALVRRLMEQMGGRIRVESPAVDPWKRDAGAPSPRNGSAPGSVPSAGGPGSAFYLTLPFRLPQEPGDLPSEAVSPNTESFDYSKAMGMVAGDAGLLKEIAGSFLDDMMHRVAQIRDLLQASDIQRVVEITPGLRGAAFDMGAKMIEGCLVRIEAMAREGNLPETEAALMGLERAIDGFQKALEERHILP